MSNVAIPVDVLNRLASMFDSTGIDLIGVNSASLFLESKEPGTFAQWSMYFQRLYRYHDFCNLELSEVTAEGGQQVAHLLVEARRHEALSIAYRIAGLAIDTADPDNDQIKALSAPMVKDELDVAAANLLTCFWAFASEIERRNFIKDYCANHTPDEKTLEMLFKSTPEAILEIMGEPANALEDLAAEFDLSGNMFSRPIYPPLHPAAQYNAIATDEQAEKLKNLPR